MRILVINDSSPPESWGGAVGIAFSLASGLQKAGHHVFAITTVQDKLQAGEVSIGGVKVYKLYTNFPNRWRAYLSLYNPQVINQVDQLIKLIRPDVVHVHNLHQYLSYYCLKISRQSGARVFLTAHDVMSFAYDKISHFIDPENLICPNKFNYKTSWLDNLRQAKKRYNPVRNTIIRHYLKYADKVFAVSSALKDALEQNKIQNVEVIHNGLDVTKWQNEISETELRSNLGIGDRPVILFFGRLSALKGKDILLKAMDKVIQEIPTAVLLLVGASQFKVTESIIYHPVVPYNELYKF